MVFDHVFRWQGMEDVWPEGRVDLTLRMRDPQTRLERLQQRVLRQAGARFLGPVFETKNGCFVRIEI